MHLSCTFYARARSLYRARGSMVFGCPSVRACDRTEAFPTGLSSESSLFVRHSCQAAVRSVWWRPVTKRRRFSVAIDNFTDTARVVCGTGYMQWSGALPSACLSRRSTAAAACGGFAVERPAGRTWTDSGRRPAARRRSTKRGQCRVDSRVDEAEHRLVTVSSRLLLLLLLLFF